MRLLLTLNHRPHLRLSFHYPYHISSWIYHILSQADSTFAQWLHEKGFPYGLRSYKLFTFSPLQPSAFRIDRKANQFIATQPPTTLVLSFWLDKALEHFVMGLFQAQHLHIGDSTYQAHMEVSSIEMLRTPQFQTTMRYRTRSPICLTRHEPENKYAQFLSPDHPLFGQYLIHNLLRKQRAIAGVPAGMGKDHWPEQPDNLKFRLLTPASRLRSRLLRIKNVNLRGFLFDFELTAPVALHQLGYFAGFGEKNSAIGMGLVDVMKGKS